MRWGTNRTNRPHERWIWFTALTTAAVLDRSEWDSQNWCGSSLTTPYALNYTSWGIIINGSMQSGDKSVSVSHPTERNSSRRARARMRVQSFTTGVVEWRSPWELRAPRDCWWNKSNFWVLLVAAIRQCLDIGEEVKFCMNSNKNAQLYIAGHLGFAKYIF